MTTEILATGVKTTKTYAYTHGTWGDALTSYNGTAITYDELGNPLQYYGGKTFEWDGRTFRGAWVGPGYFYAYTYDDEGRLTQKTGEGFTTDYVYDDDLSLYRTQTRLYDPHSGRFMSPDTYVSTGTGILGHNMYAYCNNNPVNFSDPSGELLGWIIAAVICVGLTIYDAVQIANIDEDKDITVTPASDEKDGFVQIKNSYRIVTPQENATWTKVCVVFFFILHTSAPQNLRRNKQREAPWRFDG